MNKPKDVVRQIMIHTLAAYLAMLASVILTGLLILVVPSAGKSSTSLGRILDPPFWAPQLLCGVLMGWYFKRRFELPNPGFVMLIPLTLLLWNIFSEGLAIRHYVSLKDVYFSANSGDTEGLYKLFFTAPVYTAFAYWLGSLGAKLVRPSHANRVSLS
ncbi:hypothetical protein [Tunturibacter empetritectus]|uniref:Uncharacterized protein n=1 Tax=Tunturiibacter lichenicola TaxID=2051959 RepID=A0A7W8JAV2_9BACT|nr:hypothetical protein [Edaphobacter lichenicola]MBB5345864.1 hypothetical protein [Edaphobacter lichenicola]